MEHDHTTDHLALLVVLLLGTAQPEVASLSTQALAGHAVDSGGEEPVAGTAPWSVARWETSGGEHMWYVAGLNRNLCHGTRDSLERLMSSCWGCSGQSLVFQSGEECIVSG